MDMPARSGPAGIRLGHEGDRHLVLNGHLFDAVFQQDGAVGGIERVPVMNVDPEAGKQTTDAAGVPVAVGGV